MHNKKGYLLLEMLLIMFVSSMFLALILPLISDHSSIYEVENFKSYYLNQQFNALLKKETIYLDLSMYHLKVYNEIHFNGRGNINVAQTLQFENNRKLIVELGAGRLVENK